MFFDLGVMAGVLSGGVIMYFNLRWLSSIVRGFIGGAEGKAGFYTKLILKELLLFGGVGALAGFRLVDAFGLLAGLFSLPVSVVVMGLAPYTGLRERGPGEDGPGAEGK